MQVTQGRAVSVSPIGSFGVKPIWKLPVQSFLLDSAVILCSR